MDYQVLSQHMQATAQYAKLCCNLRHLESVALPVNTYYSVKAVCAEAATVPASSSGAAAGSWGLSPRAGAPACPDQQL